MPSIDAFLVFSAFSTFAVSSWSFLIYSSEVLSFQDKLNRGPSSLICPGEFRELNYLSDRLFEDGDYFCSLEFQFALIAPFRSFAEKCHAAEAFALFKSGFAVQKYT